MMNGNDGMLIANHRLGLGYMIIIYFGLILFLLQYVAIYWKHPLTAHLENNNHYIASSASAEEY